MPLTLDRKSLFRKKERMAFYLPFSGMKSKPILLVGRWLRAAVSWLLASALGCFILSSFEISAFSRGQMYLISLGITALLYFMSSSSKRYWIGFLTFLLGAVGAAFLTGHPLDLLTGMVPSGWNAAVDSLNRVGYHAFEKLPLGANALSAEVLTNAFAVFTLFTFCTVLFVSVCRRVSMIPVAVCATCAMLPVFTFGLQPDGFDFAMIVVMICGVLTLRFYDSVESETEDDREKSALGGYLGMSAALLAALTILTPALLIREQWKPIPGINERMEIARTFFSAVFSGEKPDFSQMGNLGQVDSLGERSVALSPRSYKQQKMLEVYSSSPLPVYLRSWVAYSFANDTWRTASQSDAEVYRDIFPEFDPEMITQNFFKLAAPEISEYDPYTGSAGPFDYGFVASLVSVDILNSGGTLLYVPARFDSEYGFLSYAENKNFKKQPYSGETNRYFDGMVTTGWLARNRRYSTVAYLPNYRDESFVSSLADLEKQYQANMNVIRHYYMTGRLDGEMTYEKYCLAYADHFEASVDYRIFRNFTALSADEQTAFYQTYITQKDEYTRYVNVHYTQTHGSQALRELAEQIVKEKLFPELNDETGPISLHKYGGNFALTYLAVKSVVEYLGEEYTYTLTPSTGNGASHSESGAVETFLFVTKEGYCVQFATAATFLLREMGIPVRYVEGYLASDLEPIDPEDKRLAGYTKTVYDYNAHAWIEVYIENIGWLPFEVTALNYESIYGPGEETEPSETTSPEETDPFDTESTIALPETEENPGGPSSDQTDPEKQEEAREIVTALVLGALAVGLIVTAAILWRRKKRRLQKQKEILSCALHDRTLTGAEIMQYAQLIAGWISGACLSAGLERMPSEYPLSYAKRIDAALAKQKNPPKLRYSFAQIVPILEKTAFSEDMEREELVMLAQFWLSLREEIYARFNLFERWYYRTMREIV